MRKIDYKGWAEYLLDIMDYYELTVKSSLELAAGNCKMTDYLLHELPGLIATDLSFPMLDQNDNNQLAKVACDMTRLPFKTKFDYIICIFDSVNYLQDKYSLEAFFNEASKVLSDKGFLTFDVSLEKNSKKNVKHLNRRGKFEGIKYRQTSEYFSDNAVHINKFEIELPDGSAIEEIHSQKIFNFTDYFEVIDNTNLYVSDCFNFFTFKDADPDCERVQFVLGKI